jgi:hypothetical protein
MSKIKFNKNLQLSIDNYDEDEEPTITGNTINTVEFCGYGTLAGLFARGTYILTRTEAKLKNTNWDDKLHHVDILTNDYDIILTITKGD